ncbi:hypothetical protein [Dyadobacter aurulentus]|uniref:hypothetical protein n=1 Tax=Dyadobacter sp. UC 10 TaxID=2605428 RepID=UPI0011F1A182|nr:hypothetical protein [Dyadobacter sp. UC 10]KAA0993465.1 hypothetical protein FXO21_26450 [Dyadobacter sp. UC 10]
MAEINNSSGYIWKRFSLNSFSAVDYLFASAFTLYLALEMYYLCFRQVSHFTDLSLYYGSASKILDGQVPYRDFHIEYPILALIPVVVPEVLNRIFYDTIDGYIFWFAAQNISLGVAGGYLISNIVPDNRKPVAIWYFGLLIISLPIFLFRFDPFTAFLTAVSLRYLITRPFVSGSAMMVSIAAKLYALVMIPFLGLYYLLNKYYKKLLMHAAGFVSILLIILAAFLWIGSNAIDDFLSSHLLRGIHLESVAGGILLLFQKAGFTAIHVVHNYGALHLESSWSAYALQAVKVLTPLAFFLGLCFIVRIFWMQSKQQGQIAIQTLILAFTVQLLLFILLNKVFSPQYLVWLLPLIPFCKKKNRLIFALACMLTVIIFPGHYDDLIRMKMPMILILNLRNTLLIWLLIETIRDLNTSISQAHSA